MFNGASASCNRIVSYRIGHGLIQSLAWSVELVSDRMARSTYGIAIHEQRPSIQHQEALGPEEGALLLQDATSHRFSNLTCQILSAPAILVLLLLSTRWIHMD